MVKKDFKKISEYLWEAPPTLRPNMRVAARVYASEKIWRDIEEEALNQLINTTTLPGIKKYAIAMPDIHSGYGPPIGGVGAIDIEEGVISPGFVGYDENCLSGDTFVLLENGVRVPIRDLPKTVSQVKTVDFKTSKIKGVEFFNFFKKYTNPSLYQIKTASGEIIKATLDHPFQTKKGMKKISQLKEGDEILIYPFKGVEYTSPSEKTILSETDFKKVLLKFKKTDKRGNCVSQIIDYLKKRNLLPLKYNSPQLPVILKLMGYIFGDGVLSFGKNPQIHLYGKKEDLKEIREDLLKLGLGVSKIFSRRRRHKIETFYGQREFSTRENRIFLQSRSLCLFLIALGVPFGKKAHVFYRVPKWIFRCPLWQKRLFLASFFGAELSTPFPQTKYNFSSPQLNMQKSEKLKESATLFLQDIKKLLKEFGVQTSKIKLVPGYSYKEKQGKTLGFRLHILENAENLVRFFELVNYEYNSQKHCQACLAASYLKRKLKIVKLRERARKEIRSLYLKNPSKSILLKVLRKYDSPYVSLQFLEHSLYREKSHGAVRMHGVPRIAFNFPSFEEFVRENQFDKNGLCWDRIEKIEKVPYKDFVYDFTVNHPSHNFVANGFVVSNCGVRLLKSDLTEEEVRPHLDKLATEIQKEVPSGLGKGRSLKLSVSQIDRVLEGGVPFLVEQGYGVKEDIENCEEGGKMPMADARAVSEKAKQRGRDQLGTLGSGNHFLEIQKIEEIFDNQVAQEFGLFKNQVVVMIHTGSRGLGHQNCTDYLKTIMASLHKYNIVLPDEELASVPFNSPEGQSFFKAMSAACNFAFSNRHMIMYFVRKAWQRVLGSRYNLTLLYDVAHNIAKIETHEVDGVVKRLLVHRKGATRAFPAGRPELPERYRQIGQPVIVPGSMGTPSYVMVGTEKSKDAWHTVCHGAGRTMSRHRALRTIRGEDIVKMLSSRGIIVKCRSWRGIAEEAPQAYKNINDVVEVIHNAGLAKKVVKLAPLAVIKGE